MNVLAERRQSYQISPAIILNRVITSPGYSNGRKRKSGSSCDGLSSRNWTGDINWTGMRVSSTSVLLPQKKGATALATPSGASAQSEWWRSA
jgi:hypothetical protein